MNEEKLTLWFEHAWLPGGWARDVRLGVADGRIASVECETPARPGDGVEKIALPGLCNVHSHAFQRGMAGLSERRTRPDDDFWSWREVMYRFLDRLTPADVAAISAQAYVEMLERGFTRVGEFHYLHNDADGHRYADPAEMAEAIVHAAESAQIGLTLLPVFYAHSDFGGAAPAPGQRRFLSDIDSFAKLIDASRAKLTGDMILGVAPHSLRAVTPDELKALLPLAGTGPIHIHAAEQVKEVEACVAWNGTRPVAWLLDNHDVNGRWCLIHSTHIDDFEIERLAGSGAVAGLCPVTEANLGDGIFPATRYLGAGGRFGIGTDSNILIDAAAELRALEYSQRLSQRRRALLIGDEAESVGETLWNKAVRGGGQALGIEGELRVGASADILSLDLAHPSLYESAMETLIDRWLFASDRAVGTVWRAGRKVVVGGRHIAAETVLTRYRQVMARLLA